MTELATLIALLETSGRTFVDSYQGLSDIQFRFKPAPDRWSIAENVEHLAVAEIGSGKLMQGKLTREAPAPEVLAATAGAHERIAQRLPNRERKASAPEFVQPTGRWATAEEMTAAFEESRAAMIAFLRTTTIDLTKFAVPHPLLGPLNGHQWAHVTALHALRHAAQIAEVRAASGFPSR